MPRPKCRVIGCDEPAGNFIDVIFIPGPGPKAEHRESIGFCDKHHDQYHAGQLDISHIGPAATIDD